MRVLLQRVSSGSVTVEDRIVGAVDRGLVALVGITHDDTPVIVDQMAQKTATLRIFEDGEGKMNLSVRDISGGVLVVSQFTLYADARKGRRPSYTDAARPEYAKPLVARFADSLRAEGITRVETGVFGAMMHVQIANEGPVTLWLDSASLRAESAG